MQNNGIMQANNTVRDGGFFKSGDKSSILPPKHPNHLKYRGRNGQQLPNNTFGVSREEREKILSYKIVSPPTGLYNVKFNMTDANEKIARLIPKGSSPEREHRFDYNKTNTLLWLPNTRDMENYQVSMYNSQKLCNKCKRKMGDGLHEHSIEGGKSIENSTNHSPRAGDTL